jgi:uncharacterized protein (TIGR00106 family)
MLVDFSIIPLGRGDSLSDDLAEVLRIVDVAGVPYQLTPTGTILEGEWAEVMKVVKQCHDRMRERSPHVITTIKIEDEEGSDSKLRTHLTSVEESLGRGLRTSPGGE